MENQVITKSKFQALLQCPKRLNMVLNHKELATPVDEASQFRFDMGRRLEAIAQKNFPDGVEVSATYNLKASAIETEELILNGEKELFEAAFYSETLLDNYDVFIRTDVLKILNEKEVKLYEIKSSSSLKDQYLTDVLFQKWVIENTTDYKVIEANVIYVNPEFRLEEGYSPEDMFVIEDVTERVNELNCDPAEIVNSLSPESFDVLIGGQCKKPYKCEFYEHCVNESGIGSILDLRRGGKKIWEQFKNGVNEIENIPGDVSLSSFQEMQRRVARSGEIQVLKEEISSYLNEVQFPVYFIDFESCNPLFEEGIWEGYKMFSQVVFQVSLHKLREPGGELEHYEFLHEDATEPSQNVSRFLDDNIGNTGTVVSYHKSFEIGRIRELIERDNSFNQKFSSIIERMIDLEDIFTGQLFYSSKQKGSTSIKKTLGVVCPDLENEYAKLNVNNGQLATLKFLEMINADTGTEVRKKIKRDLLLYCGLDTRALYEIYKKLLAISNS